MSDHEHDDSLTDDLLKKNMFDEFGEPVLDEEEDGMHDLLFPGGESDDGLL